jgi:hypothetical protein
MVAAHRQAAVVFATAISLAAGSLHAQPRPTSNLLYTKVAPCRLVDTRVPNEPLVPSVPRTFKVIGSGDLSGQGGSPTGCAIPGTDTLTSHNQVQAVMLNFIAVGASGPGDLVAWPGDQPRPSASIINYAASSSLSGLNIANGLVMGLSEDTDGSDLKVESQVHGTHLVIDVLGFFSASSPIGNSITNSFVGYQAGVNGPPSGTYNTGLGFQALLAVTAGIQNTAVGGEALWSVTGDGTSTGMGNTGIGSFAGNQITTGTFNTIVGSNALLLATTGNDNTAIGEQALQNLTTGTNNIGIGYGAGSNYDGAQSLNIAIGAAGDATDGGTIRVGDGRYTSAFMGGISGANSSSGTAVFVNTTGQLGTLTSSARFKEDIADMDAASDDLLRLRPVIFHYKSAYDDGEHLLQYGLIAEEVAKVYPALVRYDKEGKPDAVRYQFLNTMLLNEVQKQHTTINGLTERLARLEQQLAALRAAPQDHH